MRILFGYRAVPVYFPAYRAGSGSISAIEIYVGGVLIRSIWILILISFAWFVVSVLKAGPLTTREESPG